MCFTQRSEVVNLSKPEDETEDLVSDAGELTHVEFSLACDGELQHIEWIDLIASSDGSVILMCFIYWIFIV